MAVSMGDAIVDATHLTRNAMDSINEAKNAVNAFCHEMMECAELANHGIEMCISRLEDIMKMYPEHEIGETISWVIDYLTTANANVDWIKQSNRAEYEASISQ
mgnify:CR=1 FL=1